MMNRQLKIWKEDFLRYYNASSILMRIVIGAVLSFLIAYILINKTVKNQNTILKGLKQKLSTQEVMDDADIQIADLKNKQRKISMQLESLKKNNALLTAEYGTLSKGEVGKNILVLRYLIDRNHLRIVSEDRIIPVKNTLRKRKSKKGDDSRIMIHFPSSISHESYKFKLLGSYGNFRQFFMQIRYSDALFFINNIQMEKSGEMLTDKNLTQIHALACSFEVHVPFMASTGNTGGKK